MTATVAPTHSAVFASLRAFILGLISCEVIQGLGDRVATPKGGFIAITELFKTRLSTNVHAYDDPTPTTGTVQTGQAMRMTVQIDCYGKDSSAWATILSTMLRDDYACQTLAPVAQPLYADDPKMIPIVDGEQQYQQRWMVEAQLQVNAIVSTPMQFFDEVEVGLVEVDTTFPP